MARKAREKVPFGTYLVQQSCVEGKNIFDSDTDRHNFLEILQEKKAQFQFKVYGYCLADKQAYKLVLYDNGSDISKIMKSINISYAYRMRNRGKIFRGRYRSTLIKSPEDLRIVLNTLHGEKPCCDYWSAITDTLLDSDIYFTPGKSNRESVMIYDTETGEICLDVNPSCKDRTDCIRTLDQGMKLLKAAAKVHGLTLEQFLSNKQLRNSELLNFRKMTTLSLKEIGTLFGGLGESAVCKIISRNMGK
ncbi:MAG: transposase [Peptostreptococcaceae bacterium]|nr:transposase [Peptostreptococcaceae bacterium]